MGITVTEGIVSQFEMLQTGGIDTDAWIIALSADTTAISESTTLSDVSIAVLHTGAVEIGWAGFDSIGLGTGDGTARMGAITYAVENTADSITLRQWIVYDPVTSTIIWGGALSPPFTPPSGFPVDLILEGITVTLGECSSPPPPPPPAVTDGLLILDSFSGSGTTQLGSHSPDLGGPWTMIDGALQVHAGVLSSDTTTPSLAMISAGSATQTITVVYTHATGTLLSILFRGQDSLNYYTVQWNTIGMQLVVWVGGSATGLFTAGGGPAGGVTYTLYVQVSGSNIVVQSNANSLLAYGSLGSFLTAQNVGVGLDGNSSVPLGTVSYFRVTNP
jgi:hypothetical protein